MSYWTKVTFIWGDARPNIETIDAALRRAVHESGFAEIVYTDLSALLRVSPVSPATADLKLDGDAIRSLLANMMHLLPTATLRVSAIGEEEGNEWFREYKGSVVITENGPEYDPFKVEKTDGIVGHMAALEANKLRPRVKKGRSQKMAGGTVVAETPRLEQILSEFPILAANIDADAEKNRTPYRLDLPWILKFPFAAALVAKRQCIGKNLCRSLQNFPKARSNAEVVAWYFGINERLHTETLGHATLSFEPIIDGVSLSLTYIKGILHSAVFFLHNRLIAIKPDQLRHIQDLPRTLSTNVPPAVAGVEVCLYLPKKAGQNGILDTPSQKSVIHAFLTSSHADTSFPEIKCLAIELSCVTVVVAKTHIDSMNFLRNMGFKISYRLAIAEYSTSEDRAFDALHADRSSMDYPVTGAIYRVNEFHERVLLSQISHPLPWALARPFDARQAI